MKSFAERLNDLLAQRMAQQEALAATDNSLLELVLEMVGREAVSATPVLSDERLEKCVAAAKAAHESRADNHSVFEKYFIPPKKG